MSIQVAQVYNIPVLFHNNSRIDSVDQIVDALKQLSRTTEDVFARISKRVSIEKHRIRHVQARVDAAQKKVDRIRGSTQAITVFSSTTYPGRADYEPTVPTHAHLPFMPQPVETTEGEDTVMPADEGDAMYRRDLRKSMLNLYCRVHLHTGARDMPAHAGLGALPGNLTSVSDMLLFNTTENPYKEYNTLDNLVGEGAEAADEERKKLAAAPDSLIDGDMLPEIAQMEFTFKPKPKEMKGFDLPASLALPNVADLAWEAKEGEGSEAFAPTLYLASLPALPSIADYAHAAPAVADAPTENTSAPPPPPSSSARAPPPPPASGGPAPRSAPAPAPAPAAAPPPPPPSSSTHPAPAPAPAPAPVAAPVPAPAPAAAPAPPKVEEKVLPPAARTDARMNLMDALNNPNNILKLRKAKAQQKKEDTKKPAPLKRKMTLGEEMKQRLLAVRAGLSGGKKSSDEGGVGAGPSRTIPTPKMKPVTEDDSDSDSGSDSDSSEKGSMKPKIITLAKPPSVGESKRSEDSEKPKKPASAIPLPPRPASLFGAGALPGLQAELDADDDDDSGSDWD